MKIVVIGSGFLGQSIIKKLSEEGHDLVAYSTTHKDNLPCRQIVGNFLDRNFSFDFLDCNPEVIIHTGWITKHGVYPQDPSNVEYADFTLRLAFEAARVKVQHLIVLGSCAEYGPRKSEACAGISELKPDTVYGKQKIKAFLGTRKALKNSETRLTWARVFQPYGPNQDQNRLIPYLANSLRSGLPVEIQDKASLNDWISTWDIASAVSWIINHETPIEVDIGTSIGHTNLDLVAHLADLFAINVHRRDDQEIEGTSFQMKVMSAESPLLVSGWKPKFDLRTGLDWTFNS